MDETYAGQLMPKQVYEGELNLRQVPVRIQIEKQIEMYEKLIQVRKELLQMLDENPGTEKVLNALRKVGI